MKELSVLVGGRAGEGIQSAGLLISQLLGSLGYRSYMYYDYPSLIRGGHNFAIVRAAGQKIGTHRTTADVIIALNQETLTRHEAKRRPDTVILFNAGTVRSEGIGIPVEKILAEEQALPVMGNTCLTGAFAKAAGIPWESVETVIRRQLRRGTELNLKVARRGYDLAAPAISLEPLRKPVLPVVTGNEAIGLGLLAGGLEAYVSYPMTPSSGVLHFLAGLAEECPLMVVHPENEIAVATMAQGFAYAGKRTAVGTSGGGFCLMTEALSMAGMNETPIVFFIAQRTGPSTGLPTYSAQTDLNFVRYAGQGEFPRFIAAPGDAEQAMFWSAIAVDIAWKYQVPAFILSDKNLSEGSYSLDAATVPPIPEEMPVLWDGNGSYGRYAITNDGVSPLAYPARNSAIVKSNGYTHDESGITTEDPAITVAMTEKRARKGESLKKAVDRMDGTVNVFGAPGSPVALLTWGSNLSACREIAEALELRVIQPVVLEPFPVAEYRNAVQGVTRVIAVEDNSLGQLAALVRSFGFPVDREIHRYDGRPFALEELQEKVRGAVA